MQSMLLVEDEQMIQDIYKKVLVEAGFTVYTASDGEQGLTEALEKHPDLMLLDISLPKMTGIEIMKRLRQDSWGETAKIVIMTNQEPTDEILNALTEGKPEYYFLKANITPEGIVLKVKEIFNKPAT